MKDIFLDEDLMSLNGTRRKERRQRFQESMDSFYTEMNNKDRMRAELAKNNENVFMEEINMSLIKDDAKEKKFLNESAMLEDDMTEDLFVGFLCEAVIDSLNIDKELVDHNREYTEDKVKSFFKATKGFMNFSNTVTSDIIASFKQSTKRTAKHEAVGFASAYCHLEPLTLVVKEKVARVIEEEKVMADLEAQLEENVYAHDVDVRMTLFREMQIENVKAAIAEQEEAGKEIVNEDIMLMSFYETVVEYTMLEVFNTLELINFSTDNYSANKTRRCINIM